MAFGVYIHFPYCRRKCPYCDFAVAVRQKIPHERYTEAVLTELAARLPRFVDRELVSIYFGGGTPSLWQADCVARLIAAIRAACEANRASLEITLEANPDALTLDHLYALRAAGVNRLSLGIQSFAPSQLTVLGRLHGPTEARQAVADARRAGFDNLSCDLMYALPGQTRSGLDRDLEAVFALGPEHLSIYGLTVEERTPFGALARAGQLVVPSSEREAELFERVRRRAQAAGYIHYEISSYARPGFMAVHNSLYWSGGQWLGLGCSAHSFRRLASADHHAAGERWATVRSVDAYLTRMATLPDPAGPWPDVLCSQHEPLSLDSLAREAMWLGLRRLTHGVHRTEYHARFGFDPAQRFAAELDRLRALDLIEVSPERIRLCPGGVLLADEIGARFL